MNRILEYWTCCWTDIDEKQKKNISSTWHRCLRFTIINILHNVGANLVISISWAFSTASSLRPSGLRFLWTISCWNRTNSKSTLCFWTNWPPRHWSKTKTTKYILRKACNSNVRDAKRLPGRRFDAFLHPSRDRAAGDRLVGNDGRFEIVDERELRHFLTCTRVRLGPVRADTAKKEKKIYNI